ncbi:glycerophosphodiester phosphodiesterase family protein [Formosa sp. 3Alg 14/1]|uniref:glycerophosphodiester phosphodiesterase family protein n=1 Tax=Formosa sp. 3Alg 14/1 TaxID=3382190 RepID=UPI0039BDAF74
MKYFIFTALIFCFISCSEVASKDSKLIETFKSTNPELPQVSVHRGGKNIQHYPENCLETLQYINDSIFAIYEIDVAQTKDGKLILMHDNAIDRTSTGTGLVKNLSYNELTAFNLVDDYGNETAFKIPLFKDVLKWAKTNNVILTIDIKRSVSQKVVIDAIREVNAEDISVIITYDVEQATTAHALAPELLLSVSARNEEEYNRLLEAEIPTKNMLAFTGTRLSNASLFEKLHAENIVCMLGTLGNLDQQAAAKGEKSYVTWKALGVDIFATDRPFAVYNALK